MKILLGGNGIKTAQICLDCGSAEMRMDVRENKMIGRIQELITADRLEEAMEYCARCARGDENNSDIMVCYLLLGIQAQETQNQETRMFDYSRDLNILGQHYHKIKFLIRRLEFDWIEADPMELVRYCAENDVSFSALIMITRVSTRDPRRVMETIKKLFQEYRENNGQTGS